MGSAPRFDDLLPGATAAGAPTAPSFADLVPAKQMEGYGRLPLIAGSEAAKGAAQSVGMLGDLQGFLQRLMGGGRTIDPAQSFAGALLNPTRPVPPEMFPGTDPANLPAYATANSQMQSPLPKPMLGSEALTGYLKDAGITDVPSLQPQNATERYVAAGARGAGGAVPFIPLGAGGAIAKTIAGLTQGVGAGIGGEAAANAFPAHPDIARAAGALTGVYGAGKLLNAANRIGGIVSGATTPTVDAYKALNIDRTLAGDVTGSPFMQMLQTFASKSQGGAGRVLDASEKATGQWGRAVEDVASNLGTSQTQQQAGKVLETEGNTWLKQFRDNATKAENDAAVFIPASTPAPPTNYATTLNDVRNSMPGMPSTAAAIEPSLTRNLLEGLIKDAPLGTPTWSDLRALRTRIGQKLEEPQLVGDTNYTDLKRLYKALTDDLDAVATAQGPQAKAAFDNAVAVTRNGHQFIENHLSNLIGPTIKSSEAAANAFSGARGGGETLQAIRQEMPAAADELAAWKLRDMSLATAGKQGSAGTQLSPTTFLTDRNNLSTEAHDALFGADPYTAQRVAQLSTVADSMKKTQQFLNTSGTGTHLGTAENLVALLGAPAAAYQGYQEGGIGGAAAGLAGGLIWPFLPGYAAGRLTTSPRLTGLLAAPPVRAAPPSPYVAGGALYPELRGLLGQ
jgi:hypothetical protein